MYVGLALALLIGVAWYAQRGNEADRRNVAILTDDEVRTAVMQGRQDLKLIALLLGAVLIMLGVIAEQIGH